MLGFPIAVTVLGLYIIYLLVIKLVLNKKNKDVK